MTRSVHPFPARMAPELALQALTSLAPGKVVLDPMAGSGTVLQQARPLGLRALGFDLDPLAVLISKVSTTYIDPTEMTAASSRLLTDAHLLKPDTVELPWVDGDQQSEAFVDFWFGERQRDDLRRLAYLLSRADGLGINPEIADALRVAVSRIIVTKAARASLAQDTSHSRPHRVLTESDYDVFDGFTKSVQALRKRLNKIPITGQVDVKRGDARDLVGVDDDSVDMVLTSPPYLNAIDYMRGHKMSLIWLGFSLSDLTQTRSNSIGAERRPDSLFNEGAVQAIVDAMGNISALPNRYLGMTKRYALDLYKMLSEVARVLKHHGSATFVMGNSCLKGVYVQNSEGLIAAAELAGLTEVDRCERDLPNSSRYLPTPTSGALSKRMRKEVIVRLQKL
jgi:tRNA G10  N-methylase Trm11